jgi:hypothetical protein
MKAIHRPRFKPSRCYRPIHSSQGLAHAAATLYFRLARGTAAQRAAAEEWKTMFLNTKQLLDQPERTA